MKHNLLNSKFAKFSKFDTDFIGNIKNINQWELLVDQFQNYLIQAEESKKREILIPKVIHQISSFGKSYKALTLDTVKSFLIDSKKSKFKI